jgi:hypothetical protein
MSETLAKNHPGATSHIKPISLIRGTLVATDLQKTRRMCEDLLGLECVQHAPGAMLMREVGHRPGEPKAGEPYWVLEVRQVEEVENPQEMLNHWGVELTSQAEVDRAYELLSEHAEEYELGRVQKPRFRNNSYAMYFVDRDSNWWEMEYRTPDLVYPALREKGDQA